MLRFVGPGLALLVAAGSAGADPSTPQVNSGNARQEDALRLWEDQRDLDEPARAATPRPHASAQPPTAMPTTVTSSRSEHVVLLTIAGISALSTVTFFAADALSPTDTSLDVVALLSGVAAVVTGGVGLALWSSRPAVQVTPTVAPGAVGVAIGGRL